MVEMLSIILLLSILSITVIARFDSASFGSARFEQELRSAIRFAHKFAIVSGCEVRVSITDTTNFYAINLRSDSDSIGCLNAGGGFTDGLNNPAGGVFSDVAPAGVDVTPDVSFVYNPDGGVQGGADQTIQVVTGSVTRTITVDGVTGYVY